MPFDFKNKYLKYKKKYTQLKNKKMIGGNYDNIQVNLLWYGDTNFFIKHLIEQTEKWRDYHNVVFWTNLTEDDINTISLDTYIQVKPISILPYLLFQHDKIPLFTIIDHIKNSILIYQMNPQNTDNTNFEYIIFSDLDVKVENFLEIENAQKALNLIGIVLPNDPTKKNSKIQRHENSFFMVKKNDSYVYDSLVLLQEKTKEFIEDKINNEKYSVITEQLIWNVYPVLGKDIIRRRYNDCIIYTLNKENFDEFGYIYWQDILPNIQFTDEMKFKEECKDLENNIINLFPNHMMYKNRGLTGNNTIPVIDIDVPPSKFAN